MNNEIEFNDVQGVQNVPNLRDIIDKKAKEKLKLKSTNGLFLLKRSRFYMNGENLREHIATYKDYAIMLKQEQLKTEYNDKEHIGHLSLVHVSVLKELKKVNGNVIRQIQPKSLHEYEKMALIQSTIVKIDEGL